MGHLEMRSGNAKRALQLPAGILSISGLVMGISAVGGSCKSDTVCPGHCDPCHGAYCYPNFTIGTSDGSRSISSASVFSDGCAVDTIVFSDGGIQGVATVLTYGGGYPCSSPPCTIQFTLRDGRTVEILAEIHQGVDVTYRHCDRNTNC